MTRFVDPAVIACPHCEQLILKRRLASFNDFGAVYWSDGYASILGLASQGRLACCSRCENLYWVEDAPVLGIRVSRPRSLDYSWLHRWLLRQTGDFKDWERREAAYRSSEPEKWEWTTDMAFPRGRELLWATRHSVADTPEREMYLRERLWWAGNHPDRGCKRRSPMTPTEAEENLERLLALHVAQPAEQISPIYAGEILRALGRFDQARERLAESVRQGNVKAGLISEAAIAGRRQVIVVGKSVFDF